jgi:hypothetical protein
MMKRISLALIMVFFISACSFLSFGQPKPTATLPPTDIPQVVIPTEVVEPTLAPLPTDTAEPLPTLELATATEEVPLDTPTPELEAWRIPPMPGAIFVASDKKSDPQYDVIVSTLATGFALPQPYYYDLYSQEAGTRYRAVQNYFSPIIVDKGYKVASDNQYADEVYQMVFLKQSSKSKIILQYMASTAKRKSASILLIYSNPQ